jgi:hypothetical protein
MKKISRIYTYGSSFTQGGGFEFDSYNGDILNKFYKKFAPSEERTQYNFSWPGQLRNLSKLSVINQGKSGYGIERVIRLAHEDIISQRDKNRLDKTLFLFEFPSLGRKEYYCNTINDYVITNYTWRVKGHEDTDHIVLWDDSLEYYCDTHGIANTYFVDPKNPKLMDAINKNTELFENFNKLTMNYTERTKELSRMVVGFLSFLEQQKINYIIVNNSFMYETYMQYIEGTIHSKKQVDYEGNGAELYSYIDKNNLTITDETNGQINDGHGGYIANKNLAEMIYNRIKEDYTFTSISSLF